MSLRIALAVSAEIAARGGTGEDRLIASALEGRGIEASPVPWDGDFEWGGCDGVFVRSCWDYHLRPDAFRSWLDRLEALGVPVWNPLSLVRWNIDKRYLRDLAERGVAVVPTLFVEGRAPVRLPEWLIASDGETVVVKPAIGATAHATERLGAAAAVERLASDTESVWLVQPFLEEIAREGEWSLLWMAGTFRHAVVKRPGEGDYRVQAEWGGSVERREPDEELVAAARRIVEGLEPEPLIARVDLVRRAGEPLLMELELIEPQLFLGPGDPGLDAIAERIYSSLESRGTGC